MKYFKYELKTIFGWNLGVKFSGTFSMEQHFWGSMLNLRSVTKKSIFAYY